MVRQPVPKTGAPGDPRRGFDSFTLRHSFFVNGSVDRYGDGADCRSVVLRCPEGSIPSTPTTPL